MAVRFPRKSFFTRNGLLSVVLLLGIAVEVNWLARARLVVRGDLTQDREYTIAAASRGVVGGLEDRLLVTAYFTPKEKVPPLFVATWRRVADLLAEYRAYGEGKVIVEFVDPAEGSQARADAERMGVKPFPVQFLQKEQFSQQLIFMGLVLRYQDRDKTIPAIRPADAATMEYQLTTAIKALVSARNPKVAFFSREPDRPPRVKGMGELPMPPERIYQGTRDALADRIEIQDVKLKRALVPEDVDVLVALRPKEVSAHEAFAIDQFVMRGGRLLVLLDHGEYPPAERFRPRPFEIGEIENLLAHWGVRVPKELVFENDRSAATMPMERPMRIGNREVTVQAPVPYPFWAMVSDAWEGFAKTNPATDRLAEAVFLWASPVETIPERLQAAGLESEWLVRSSPRSWRTTKLDRTFPSAANLSALAVEHVRQEPQRSTIALAVSGSFPSYFEGREAPPLEKEKPGEKEPESRPAPAILGRSRPTNVVVIGDSDFVADYVLSGRAAQSRNFLFLANLVDWLSLDRDLISIRTRGTRDRDLTALQERREAYADALGVRPGSPALESMTQEEYRRKQDRIEEELQDFKNRVKLANVVGMPLLLVLFGAGRAILRSREKRAYLARFAKGPASPPPGSEA